MTLCMVMFSWQIPSNQRDETNLTKAVVLREGNIRPVSIDLVKDSSKNNGYSGLEKTPFSDEMMDTDVMVGAEGK